MKTKAKNGVSFDQMKDGFTNNNNVANEAQAEQASADVQVSNSTGVAKRLAKKAVAAKGAKANKKAPKKPVSQAGVNITIENARKVNKALAKFFPSYASPFVTLALPALDAMYVEAKSLEKAVSNVNSKHTVILNVRGALYRGLNSYGTRIVGQIKACGVDKKTLEDAQKILKKMRGVRIIAIDPDSTDKHISAAHTGFMDKLAYFEELIETAANIEAYAEVTGDNSVNAMQERYERMDEANDAADSSQADVDAARRARNAYFNTDITGLVDTYQRVKANVKAGYGATSAEFKAISGLVFAKIRE